MKKINKHHKIFNWGCYILVAMLFISYNAKPQKAGSKFVPSTNIKLIARASTDSVVLRWAPATPGGWLIANSIGYRIEKLELAEGVEISNSLYKPLQQQPIFPMTLNDWKTYAGPDNKFSAIAAQALYGAAFNPNPLNAQGVSSLRNAADELTNRYSFALFAADNDPITANALGLRYVDKAVKPDARYLYRVYVAKLTPEMAFDTSYVMVQTSPVQRVEPPIGLAYRSGDRSIELSWGNNPNSNFTGYYLWRSDDGGKTFLPKNSMPMVFTNGSETESTGKAFYIDTGTVNYKTYIYKIAGVTPFGELSMPVEVRAMSRDLTPPPAPIVLKPKQIGPGKIKLQWQMNNPTADFKGFMIAKSLSANGGFNFITTKPLPKHTKEFSDDLADTFEAYYMVASVDTAGNLNYSAPVLASLVETPVPASPKNLNSKTDNEGRVTLSWQAVKNPNVIGYRILRANDPTHEFIPVTGYVIADTLYVDSISLNTLTRNIYYRVVAVNSRYQNSEPSAILKVRRPDKIPPAEAVFKDISVTDKSVTLKWHCSPSSDVAKQYLLRKVEGQSEWMTHDSLKPGIAEYVDINVKPKTTYYYTLVSVDSSGNKSKPSNPVYARPYDSGKREAVRQFVAVYNQTDRTTSLRWDYSQPVSDSYWFVIYKSTDGINFSELKALKSNTRTFVDSAPGKGKVTYGVVVMTTDGGQSEMAKATVNVP